MKRKIILNIPDTEYDLTVGCKADVISTASYSAGVYQKSIICVLSEVQILRCEIDEFANRAEGEAAADAEFKKELMRIMDLLYKEAVEQWI
jgi:hypothetical protein